MKLDCIHYLTAGCVGPQTFLSERAAFLREHHNGMYCVSVYYLCRMIAEVSNAISPFFFHMTYTSNESKTLGPDLQNILRQSYDYLTIMPKLRSTYDGRLIYRTSYEERKDFLIRNSLAKL